jgi:ribonuclease D
MISRFLPEGVRRFLGGAKPKAALPTYVLLDQPGQLEPLLALIDQVDEVCLDTEADNMHRYRTRVCLLQFLVKDEVFLDQAFGHARQRLRPPAAARPLRVQGEEYL